MDRAILFAVCAAVPAVPGSGSAAFSGPAWENPVEIASGGGEKGPWRQNDSRYDYVDDATVAFSPHGGQVVAWVDQGSKDVWLRSVAPGGRLGAPVNVSRSPATFSWLPRIAIDPRQGTRIFLIWQEIIFSGGSHGGDILFARSSDGGKTFAAPLNLSRSQGGDGKGRLDRATWSNGSLDLVAKADGTVLASWTEYHGALWMARSLDGGASFSNPRRIAGDDARPARAPSLAAGPGGIVHLAWTVGEDPRAAIRVARSADNGASFGAPQLVDGGDGQADAPRLAVDAGGRLHLVFAQRPSPRDRFEVRYTQAARDGTFGPARALSGGAPGSGAAYPMLACDGGKGLSVIWENMGTDGRPEWLGITLSRDGGRSFTAPAKVPGSDAFAGASNGSEQGLLGQKLAVDRGGRIAIVNSRRLPGVRSRVWLLRAR